MKIREYLKERLFFLIVNITLFIIVSILMKVLHIGSGIVFLVFCIWFLPILSYISIELVRKKKYYDKLEDTVNNLDKKYLLTEVIDEPNKIEERIFYDILKDTDKEMHEHVNKYRDMQIEYREYIETWVHEIKTPIASARLMIENNENEITKNIEYEIKKIEGYIEQVLYYSKSNDVSKDYIIKEFDLKDIVRKVIKKNSRDFITKKISLDIENINGKVCSDIKWVEFILNQILGNAIKYSKVNNAKVTIYSCINENNIILTIQDNGVGIVNKDIGRVFEKGFTGENGRKFGKSTGIGLYLCKKLCERLGLGLSIISKEDIGTKVNIIFPMGKFTVF